MSEERKDFAPWQVELVYRKQDGTCLKCGGSLAYGFHRDHKDGDHANNAMSNLRLLCPKCHNAEQYATLVKQKKKWLEQTEVIINLSAEEKTSGSALAEIKELIKIGLSLVEQVYGVDIEKPPASIRMENYLVSSGILIKEREKGFQEGFLKGVDSVIAKGKAKEKA